MEINSRIQAASGAFGGLGKPVWSQYGISVSTKCKVYKAIVLPTLLYSAETYTLYRCHFIKLSKVHLRQILLISWKDHIPNVEVLRRANMSSIEATPTASQLRWTGHIICMNDSILPKGCILWRISQRETSSWWTTAAIQRCSQTTPKGYTHRSGHLWETLAQDRQQRRQAIHKGKSHIEENIS